MQDARSVNGRSQNYGGIITSPPYIEAESYAGVGSLSSICPGMVTDAQIEQWRHKTIGHEESREITPDEVTASDLPELAKKTIGDIITTPEVKAKAATVYA